MIGRSLFGTKVSKDHTKLCVVNYEFLVSVISSHKISFVLQGYPHVTFRFK